MKPVTVLLLFATLLFEGCGPPNDGFRFDGEYGAPQSGYLIHLLSEGYVPPGGGAGGQAFAIVQLCPAATSDGRPIRMIFTATRDGRVNVESGELGPVAMNWDGRTSEGMMRGLLTSAGFRHIDPGELGATLAVIGRSLGAAALSGRTPPGGSLRVAREDLTEAHAIDHDKLPAEWVAQSEVPGCK
jgi:hypothetical protein